MVEIPTNPVTRICLVRHGETEWNAARRIQGQIDIGLNETGCVRRGGRPLAENGGHYGALQQRSQARTPRLKPSGERLALSRCWCRKCASALRRVRGPDLR
jgi:hypothetical protein